MPAYVIVKEWITSGIMKECEWDKLSRMKLVRYSALR